MCGGSSNCKPLIPAEAGIQISHKTLSPRFRGDERKSVGDQSMTQRTAPPFRADMVGSLLRTAPLKEARAKFAKGEIDSAALRAVEDREIEKIIKKQADVGLKLATDGEFRRSWWHFDFFRALKGIEFYQTCLLYTSDAADE